MQFAIHLVRSGVISAPDLVDALEHQSRQQKPLGQMALENGLLSIRQVLEVLKIQDGRRFGEVAIELGYLTEASLASLLLSQANTAGPVEERLVDLGVLTRSQLEDERIRFRNREAAVVTA